MKTKPLRIVFMGTPDFSVPALEALAKAGHEVVCVYTQPPRPAGRGHKIQKSAVHQKADTLNIPVRTPEKLKKNETEQEAFADLKADVAVVAAYGLILPQEILDAPKHGCLNIHASLLPRWRGAAPIHRAILAGDDKSGVCIMQMEAGLDTGPVLKVEETPITATTTAQTLHDTLSDMGARMICDVVDHIADGTPYPPTPQTENGVTYAHMLTKDEGKIDWSKPATDIERQLRALTPWPGVWFDYNNTRFKILAASVAQGSGAAGTVLDKKLTIACGDGALRLETVQPAGRKAMDGASVINGNMIKVGDCLA